MEELAEKGSKMDEAAEIESKTEETAAAENGSETEETAEEVESNVVQDFEFPNVVLRHIFHYLGGRDSLAASQTCRGWRWVGKGMRGELRYLRVCEFYKELINEERYIEFPVFHRREDLAGLILVRTPFVKKLIRWLKNLFPNVTELAFRNFIRRERGGSPMLHPSRFHVFIINELMSVIGRLWPNLEMLDVSGEVVDVRAMHHVKHWDKFREVRMSGCDLSYNMLKTRHLVAEALTKTFWKCPLAAMRLSNLDFKFDLTFERMTMFKALGNKSLTTFWLNEFFKEAVNLESLSIDCQYLHDENIVLIGNLTRLQELILRNCTYVNDFAPLGKLPMMRSVTIDFGDKGTEDQLCEIVSGSKNWRRVIFNEVVETVGNRFLLRFAKHCRKFKCPLIEFELNTEKTSFPFIDHDWVLPDADAVGIGAMIRACPLLETLGVCTRLIDDAFLIDVAASAPRLHNLIINNSEVTNDGVLEFYETLRRRRIDRFGVDNGCGYVDVRWTNCTQELPALVRERFKGQLRIFL